MRNIYAIVLILLFTLQSCKKEKERNVLTGSWRLIEVSNDTLSAQVPRPANANGDFIITFESASTFSGHTFRNTIYDGSYTLSDNNQLRFGVYSATKIAEDAWGSRFNKVLMSCMLQSLYPCTPSLIYIQDNRLKITTPFQDDLTFERVR